MSSNEYPGTPGPYWIGSTLIQIVPTPLRTPERMPEPPEITGPISPRREEWTLADELDSRCNSVHTMNQYYR